MTMTTKNQLVNDILHDSGLVQSTIRSFVDAAVAMVKNADVTNNFATWTLDAVLHAAGIEKVWTKESYMSIALWVLFFAITGEHYPTAQLKYQSLDAFLEAYDGYFNNLDPMEQELLKNEANWFNVVSVLLPPRMSKGLTIQVVPRLVEGWQAKYVTGSGQTETTKRRVFIFEKEGNVAPLVREGRSSRRTNVIRKDKRTTKSSKKAKASSSSSSSSSSKIKTSSSPGMSTRGRKPKNKVIPSSCVYHDVDGQTIISGEAALMVACQWTKYELVETTRATDRTYKNHKNKEMERKLQQDIAQQNAVMALQLLSNSIHPGNGNGGNGSGSGIKTETMKSPQRIATERLFQPSCHQNTLVLTSLCEELGLDSNDIDAAEAILLCMETSSLQRLAACLKMGPQCLFKKIFLVNTSFSSP